MNEKILRKTIVAIFVLMFVFAAVTIYALETVIGETNIILNGERNAVRTQETNLGNLVTDVIRDYTGADVVIYNGGGIRASADLGEITLEKAMEILAFNNEVVTLRVTGATLIQVLELGVSSFPEVAGKFLQVSGLRFYFNPNNPVGEKVLKVYVGGEPLLIDKTYVLATNEFLAAGGDAYDMLGEAEQLEVFDITDQAMFIRYLMENSPVFPKVEGRIVVVW